MMCQYISYSITLPINLMVSKGSASLDGSLLVIKSAIHCITAFIFSLIEYTDVVTLRFKSIRKEVQQGTGYFECIKFLRTFCGILFVCKDLTTQLFKVL